MPEDIPEGWSYYRPTCCSRPHSRIIKNRRRKRKLHYSGCEIKPGIEHDQIASASTLVNTRAKRSGPIVNHRRGQKHKKQRSNPRVTFFGYACV